RRAARRAPCATARRAARREPPHRPSKSRRARRAATGNVRWPRRPCRLDARRKPLAPLTPSVHPGIQADRMRYLILIGILVAIVAGLAFVKTRQFATMSHAMEAGAKAGPPPEVV